MKLLICPPKLFTFQCNICGSLFSTYAPQKQAKKCGCPTCSTRKRQENKVKKYIGKKYESLIVVSCDHNKKDEKARFVYANCKCLSCGKMFSARLYRILNGTTTQCPECENKKRLQLLEQYRPETHKGDIDGTRICSIKSREINKNNSTGVKGVSYYDGNRYRAAITFKRKQYHLGVFNTLEEAAEARRIAEKKLFGEFLKEHDK